MQTESTTDLRRHRSRVLRPAALLLPLFIVGLLAAPAAAVPEGFSNPDPVSPLQALLVYVVAPLGVAAVITLLVLLPSLAGAAKAAPAITDVHVDDEATYAELEGGEPEEGSLDALFAPDKTDDSAVASD